MGGEVHLNPQAIPCPPQGRFFLWAKPFTYMNSRFILSLLLPLLLFLPSSFLFLLIFFKEQEALPT